ncbi:MAG: carboxypeptidase regulatory-like domain-containing protein [Planctomycetota bacterium]
MSRPKSLLIGTFAALLLIAIAIAIAPFGKDSTGTDTNLKSKDGGLLASLPAIDKSKTESSPGAARESAGGLNDGSRSASNGKVIITEGGAVPPGTRVAIRFDNPDFMSEMTMGDLMRRMFQRGIAGQKELIYQIRNGKKEGEIVNVAADGTFRINPPAASPFYLNVLSDLIYNDTWEAFTGQENEYYQIRARRGFVLKGIVNSPNGAPVAGADVELVHHLMPGSGGRIRTPREMLTKSGADGSFTITAVPVESTGSVAARKPGFALGIVSITLKSPPQPLVVTLTPAGRIVGRVADAEGGAVAGAAVSLVMSDFVTYGLELKREPAITNSDGHFEMIDIPAGALRVRAEKATFRPAQSLEFEARPGTTTDVGFVILQNGTRIAGTVVTPDGKPAEGAEVKLEFSTDVNQFEPVEGGALIGDLAVTTTNAEGKFLIEGMARGPYDIEARLPGFAPARKKRYKEEGRDLILKLRKPGAIECLVRWPEASPPPAELLASLEISIVTGPGFSVPETVKSQKIAGVTEPNAKEFRFRMEDVAPGSYSLLLKAKGYAKAKQQNVDVKSATPAQLQFDLVPGVSVAGRAVDKATKQPLSGARVELSTSLLEAFRGDAPSTITKEDGTFELKDLEAGPLSIFAQFMNHARATVPVGTPKPGDMIQNVEIELGLGGAIDGQVFNDDGLPMAGGIANINSPDRGDSHQLMIDREGRFFQEHLSPGTYQISALRGSFLSDMSGSSPAEFLKGMKFTMAEVKEGEVKKVVMGEQAGPFVKVVGKVKSRNQAVGNAIITAISQTRDSSTLKSAPPKFETTNAQGIFEVKLPPGRTMFTIQRVGSSQMGIEIPADIPNQPAHELTLNLPVATLEGVVRGAKNEPLAGQPVLLSIEQGVSGSFFGSFGQTSTDEDGHYIFENLNSGSFVISAGGVSVYADTGANAYGRVARRVQVAENENIKNIDFNLGAAGSVAGNVISSGKPVPGASIFFQTTDGLPLSRISDVFTNVGGQFRARGIAAGNYRILARARGFAARFVEVRVEAGREHTIDIELDLGAPVLARVLDKDGTPVSGVTVLLMDSDGRRMSGFAGIPEFTQVFAEGPPPIGDVRLGTLGRGKYRITVTRSGYAPSTVDFDIPNMDARTIEVRLQKEL